MSEVKVILRLGGPCLYSDNEVVRISGIYCGFLGIRILRILKGTGKTNCLPYMLCLAYSM